MLLIGAKEILLDVLISWVHGDRLAKWDDSILSFLSDWNSSDLLISEENDSSLRKETCFSVRHALQIIQSCAVAAFGELYESGII